MKKIGYLKKEKNKINRLISVPGLYINNIYLDFKIQNIQKIRIISSLFLLILFLFNILGYYMAFYYEHYQCREEMMDKILNKLPDNKFTIIKIHKDQPYLLKWSWENNEFSYDNKMYDIVRKVTRNDSILYYCLNDLQEELLYSDFKDLLRSSFENELSHNSKLNFLLENIFKDFVRKDYSFNLLLIKSTCLFFNPCSPLKYIYICVAIPPPKEILRLV
jgi:hypothetical protein